MDIFTILFYQPIYNLLVVFYRLFGENLGLAIISIALLSRLILIPLTLRQQKMASSSREFSEKSKEIKEKYKKNKEKQQEELMKLQSEYLPSQLAGCLPLIFQLILLINIDHVIRNLFTKGVASFSEVAYGFVPVFGEGYTLNSNFLGINLSDSASSLSAAGASIGQILPYILIILLVGITQYFSTKYMMGMQAKPKEEPKKERKDKETPGDMDEILRQTTQQTLFLTPIMIMLFAYNFASGLGIYWITQSLFIIGQQFVYRRFFLKENSKGENFLKDESSAIIQN